MSLRVFRFQTAFVQQCSIPSLREFFIWWNDSGRCLEWDHFPSLWQSPKQSRVFPRQNVPGTYVASLNLSEIGMLDENLKTNGPTRRPFVLGKARDILKTSCTHTPCRTHMFFAFFIAWRTDTNTHGSMCLHVCHISPSRSLHSHVSSSVFAAPARSLRHHVQVCTVFVELDQTQKRGSSAPPHVRQGVWLIGRSHALNKLWTQKELDKTTSVDGERTPINDPDHDVSNFSKNTPNENTGLFGVSQSV